MAGSMRIGELFADVIFRDLTGPGLDAVDRGLTRTERKLRRLDRGLGRTADRMQAASRVAFGMGAALTGALVGIARAAGTLEGKVSEVAAKTGIAAASIRDEYVGALKAIGDATGETDIDLLDGLQKALSAGLRGDAALDVVRAGAKAAAAGIGAIGDQVSSATTLMAVFKISGADALDTIARSAQLGEGNTADFAQGLKGVSGFANQLGITAHGTAAGLAAVSQVAASVPEGMTQFRSFLQSLLSPSAQARTEIEGLQDSFSGLRDLARREGLAAVLARVRELGAGDPERLARLLGRTEAQAFVLTVDSGALADLEADLAGSLRGTIDRAMAEGGMDLFRGLKKLAANVRHLFQELGAEILPEVNAVVRAAMKVVTWLRDLPGPLKSAMASATLFGPVLIGLAGALRLAAGGIRAMRQDTVLMGRAVEKGMGAAQVARIGLFRGALRSLAMSTLIGAALTGLLLLINALGRHRGGYQSRDRPGAGVLHGGGTGETEARGVVGAPGGACAGVAVARVHG